MINDLTSTTLKEEQKEQTAKERVSKRQEQEKYNNRIQRTVEEMYATGKDSIEWCNLRTKLIDLIYRYICLSILPENIDGADMIKTIDACLKSYKLERNGAFMNYFNTSYSRSNKKAKGKAAYDRMHSGMTGIGSETIGTLCRLMKNLREDSEFSWLKEGSEYQCEKKTKVVTDNCSDGQEHSEEQEDTCGKRAGEAELISKFIELAKTKYGIDEYVARQFTLSNYSLDFTMGNDEESGGVNLYDKIADTNYDNNEDDNEGSISIKDVYEFINEFYDATPDSRKEKESDIITYWLIKCALANNYEDELEYVRTMNYWSKNVDTMMLKQKQKLEKRDLAKLNGVSESSLSRSANNLLRKLRAEMCNHFENNNKGS